MQTASDSVPAYSSRTRSGPSQSIQALFTGSGHGAPTCSSVRTLDRSAASRTSAGSRRIRPMSVGTA